MINKDKGLHFIVGLVIGGLTGSILLTLLVAISKEVYDYYLPHKHTCDCNDAIATVVGGLVGIHIFNFIWSL